MVNDKAKDEEKKEAFRIEQRIMNLFKGQPISLDEVDFETKNALYEVKSCKLFNRSYNGNHLRKFKKKRHKKIETYQLGRFKIKTDNHIKLYLRSLQTGKVPKYVFVIRVGRQIIFKSLPWEKVILTNDRDLHQVPIATIFHTKLGLEDGE